MFTLLDLNGKLFAMSVSLDALMLIMRGRWAGTVVNEKGKVLFDIKTDRTDDKDTVKRARAEKDLAWERHCKN